MKYQVIHPYRGLALKASWVFTAVLAAVVLSVLAAGSAKAAGLEDSTINTIYEAPRNASGAYVGYPSAVATDSRNNLYVALIGSYTRTVVMRIDALTGEATPYAGSFNVATAGAGDGGPAADANIRYVLSLAFDSKDNLYISDHGNHKVRVVSPEPPYIITTYAGNGSAGASSGDGGPATDATLNYVFSLSLDEAENLYIGDYGMIRRVDRATGTITTVAGSSTVSTSHEAPSPTGPTSGATLSPQLEGMAFDSAGNMYFGSSSQWLVRRVAGDFSVMETFAGGGDSNWGDIPENAPAAGAFISYPDSVAVDGKDNVYIGARQMNCVRMVDQNTGLIHTVAGRPGTATGFSGDGGPAKYAELALPFDVCMDGAGNMYIADTLNYRVRKIGNPCSLPQAMLTGAEASEGGAVSLDWMIDGSTGCGDVEGFVVMRDGVEIASLDGAATSYDDSIPAGCRDYCYTVRAVAGDEFTTSNERCVSAPDAIAPDTPSNVAATAISGSEVLLTWDEASDVCDGTAAGYAVSLPDGSVVETSDTSYSVTGLSKCQEYCFSVSAYDTSGNYSADTEACAATDFPTRLVVETSGEITGKNSSGEYSSVSALQFSFSLTSDGKPVDGKQINGPVPVLYRYNEDKGVWKKVDVPVKGKVDTFVYKNGKWSIKIQGANPNKNKNSNKNDKNGKSQKNKQNKGIVLEPGEYMLYAVPNQSAGGSCDDVEVVFRPLPSCSFTLK